MLRVCVRIKLPSMFANAPAVKPGEWIRIGNSVRGHVFSVNTDGSLEVGYAQTSTKAIKEAVQWNGSEWEFKFKGPNGTYLRGSEATIVFRGPYAI